MLKPLKSRALLKINYKSSSETEAAGVFSGGLFVLIDQPFGVTSEPC